jgi:hypothetical protein
MAQSGHSDCRIGCPLLGVKRTSIKLRTREQTGLGAAVDFWTACYPPCQHPAGEPEPQSIYVADRWTGILYDCDRAGCLQLFPERR